MVSQKQAYIYINYSNIVVLQSYLEVIQKALIENGYKCEFTKSLETIDKSSLIVHPMAIDALKYYLKGYKNFILWQQGATADESYLRHHSKVRYWLLNRIDTFAMKKAKFILFVSNYMKLHYEKLADCSFEEKSYTMPCFNEKFDENIYKRKDFSKKTFTYAGSLDLWQCFDQTVDLYKEIEAKVSNAMFKVLTFQVDEAKRILEEKGVKNYIVKCVPKDDVKKELVEMTYGFILREDSMVNRVATPTKFSSYLAAGVIPIFSECLRDFASVSSNMKYILKIGKHYSVDEVVAFVNLDVDMEELKSEYKSLFDSYYSVAMHISNLKGLFRKIAL